MPSRVSTAAQPAKAHPVLCAEQGDQKQHEKAEAPSLQEPEQVPPSGAAGTKRKRGPAGDDKVKLDRQPEQIKLVVVD